MKNLVILWVLLPSLIYSRGRCTTSPTGIRVFPRHILKMVSYGKKLAHLTSPKSNFFLVIDDFDMLSHFLCVWLFENASQYHAPSERGANFFPDNATEPNPRVLFPPKHTTFVNCSECRSFEIKIFEIFQKFKFKNSMRLRELQSIFELQSRVDIHASGKP